MAIKVKQSTIDEIKKMGMTKALASAKTRRSPEYQEAIRRMYGERRLTAAMKGAQGGSQSRATYMYKGTPGMKKKTTTGRSTPGAPTGTGSKQKTSRNKSTRQKAGAVGAGVAALGALTYQQSQKPGVSVLTNRPRGAEPKLPPGGPARNAYRDALRQGKTPRAALAAANKVAALPASKRALALRAGSRLLGAAAAPVLARDAIMAGSGALKKGIAKTKGGTAALKRLNKSGGTGSGRAAQMKNIKRKTKGR
jgi:hypothetical protein